ncbi:MAG TPA: sodium ABC transporter ATP-binding protein, partial [Syntrophomonas sp.]|nr:sodium ABC transporter ATP-binding protein [Syntrophomonas sp.]
MDTILDVKDLKRSFPDFQLGKISFSLPRGYVMGFVGPNGSGKS